MESVDIVNEDNQVLYQISKADAHQKGLLHRTIIAEVINTKDEWLLVKQASDRQDAGQFVSPVGGHVQAGETELDALKREAKEELGLRNFTYKYIGKAIFNRTVLGRKENHYFILYEIYSNQKPLLNRESESFQRFSFTELKNLFTHEPNLFGNAFHFVANAFYKNLLL